jgi:hypothetical protein
MLRILRRPGYLLAPLVAIPLLVLASGTAWANTTAAHWAMNEPPGTGVMHDDSGNDNDGTWEDITATGSAYKFNGVSSRVIVPDDPTLDPGSADFSYTVRFKTSTVPDDVVGDFDLLRKGLSSNSGGYYKAELFPNSANTAARPLCQAAGSSGTAKLVGGVNLADGAWHVITCEKKAQAFNLRLDGALILSKSVVIGSISNGAPLTVGAKSNGGDWFKGSMKMATLVVG